MRKVEIIKIFLKDVCTGAGTEKWTFSSNITTAYGDDTLATYLDRFSHRCVSITH